MSPTPDLVRSVVASTPAAMPIEFSQSIKPNEEVR